MKVSPFIFFLIKEGKLILWDYKLHNQFEITNDYLEELTNLSSGNDPLNKDIYIDLVQNNIIVNDDNPSYSDDGWGWDDLAKIFHIGTQDLPHENLSDSEYSRKYIKECEAYFEKAKLIDHKSNNVCIKLPENNFCQISKSNFLKTLCNRQTSRNFNDKLIELKKISTLMELTFSSSDRHEKYYNSLNLNRVGDRKTSPSGGGLHPSQAYLYVNNVENLDKGIYKYDTKLHGLIKVNSIDNDFCLGKILNNQYFANDLSAGIFITSDFRKQWWKYKHSRAYRVALLDIGHLSQTLLLISTALSMSTWISAAFDDTEVSKLLNTNHINEKPILFVGVGYSNGNPIDRETLNILGQHENQL